MAPADGSGLVVSARDLSIHYRSAGSQPHYLAVRGITFDLAPGEILGVIGESGSGKSTLGLSIAGLAGRGRPGNGRPQICGGSLEVLGTRVRHLGRRRRDRLTLRVGYLRQDAAERLSPLLTVAENVAEPIFMRDRRFNVREAADAVATVVDGVRLPLGLMNKLPYQLSSGQRQRVALARALILEPQLLVADEPTRGVDATVRDGVLDVLHDLQREREFSAIIVSSDLAVLTRTTSRLAVLQHGSVVGMGAVDALLSDPVHPYLKSLARSRSIHGSVGAGDHAGENTVAH